MERGLLVSLVILVCSPSRGVSLTIITQDPGSVTGTEEGEVTVPCTVTGAPPGSVRWYRDTGSGRQYLYCTSPPPPSERNDPRVSQVYQNHPTDLSIRIVNLTLSDSGMYYCEKYKGDDVTLIASGSGSRLSVRAIPALIIIQDPGSVTGIEEGEVTVPCTVTGGPAGPVRWYRDSGSGRQYLYSPSPPPPNERNDPRVFQVHQYHPTDLSIRIVRLTLRDSGTYYCEKYKVFDGSLIASGSGSSLSVRALPPLIITQDPDPLTGTKEGEVTLPCTLSTVGPPGPVRWYRDTGSGRQYLYSPSPPPPNERNDPRVSRVHPDHPTDLSIRIVNLTLRDSGRYYCEKYRGSDETLIASGSGSRLSVRALPPLIITQDPDPLTGTEEGEVTVRCTLSTVGPPGPVRWYRDTGSGRQYLYSTARPPPNERNDPRVSQVHQHHATDLSIRIVNLTLSDSGSYYCEKYRGFDGSLITSGSGSRLSVREPPCCSSLFLVSVFLLVKLALLATINAFLFVLLKLEQRRLKRVDAE